MATTQDGMAERRVLAPLEHVDMERFVRSLQILVAAHGEDGARLGETAE